MNKRTHNLKMFHQQKKSPQLPGLINQVNVGLSLVILGMTQCLFVFLKEFFLLFNLFLIY